MAKLVVFTVALTALGGALTADGILTLAGLAVCALAFAALTAAGAAWFARSEER